MDDGTDVIQSTCVRMCKNGNAKALDDKEMRMKGGGNFKKEKMWIILKKEERNRMKLLEKGGKGGKAHTVEIIYVRVYGSSCQYPSLSCALRNV